MLVLRVTHDLFGVTIKCVGVSEKSLNVCGVERTGTCHPNVVLPPHRCLYRRPHTGLNPHHIQKISKFLISDAMCVMKAG